MISLTDGIAGRTVIVTGSASGIGAAVAQGFAELGARAAGVDLAQDGAARFAEGLSGAHAGFAADLSDIAALPGLVEWIETALGPATILVNTAGVIRRNGDLFPVTEAEWDLQHGVNLKSVFFLSQAVARRLSETGTHGAIVNDSSQGWMSGGFGGSVVYNAAKGGVTVMTRGLARSRAPLGIRVNAVAPGLVDTPMLRQPGTTEAELDALRGEIPLARLGVPDDHVGATVFLASDAAAYVTGATLNVSGGFLMY